MNSLTCGIEEAIPMSKEIIKKKKKEGGRQTITLLTKENKGLVTRGEGGGGMG